jgi:hypothetical protein
MEINGGDWRELCAAAAEEPDAGKLLSLVNQILDAFAERDRKAALPERSDPSPDPDPRKLPAG